MLTIKNPVTNAVAQLRARAAELREVARRMSLRGDREQLLAQAQKHENEADTLEMATSTADKREGQPEDH
jgi:hypothetical protein